MSIDQPNNTDEMPTDSAQQESLRSPMSVLKNLVAKAKEKPIQAGLYSGGFFVLLFVAAFAMWLTTQSSEVDENITIEAALEKLNAGDYPGAKQIAAKLRELDSLPYTQRSLPAYVLGVATHRQAENEWSKKQKSRLFMIAARHLEEAWARDFPPEIKSEGLLLLAESLHHSGRYAKSLPILREALEESPQADKRLLQLISKSFLLDVNPNYAKALQHNQAYLSNKLSPSERNLALLEQAKIFFGSGDLEKSREALAKTADVSDIRADVILMRGQLLMHEAEQLSKHPELIKKGENKEKSVEKYQAAIQEFRLAQTYSSFKNQATKPAKYLLGICLRRIGDYQAAETLFSSMVPPQFEIAESLAGGLENAEIKQMMNKSNQSVAVYRRVLEMAGDPVEYSNPWVSLDQLRKRLLQSYRSYLDNHQQEQAIILTRALWPIYSRTQAVQMRAEAQRAWAEDLAERAAKQNISQAKPLLVKSRAHYRKAGIDYATLAKYKTTSREYPEEIWRSADNYFLGHNYIDAVRMLKEYLKIGARPRTPEALVAMGEAQLALGYLDEAIASLTNCINRFPKHPDTYQARLVASSAYLEKGEMIQAKKLLIDNLHNESLTPRSSEWRDSLFALGKVFHQEGVLLEAESRYLRSETSSESKKIGLKKLESSFTAHQEAVKKLTEAVFRYPDVPQAIVSKYLIARSHAESAKWPAHKLTGISIETTKLALHRQMHDELHSAMKIYDSLLQTLNEKQDLTELTRIESSILRNCYFARADILFDTEDYEGAIDAYSTATNRYHGKPESMEAFVQIARCYRELGRYVEARGTLEQAKVVLRRVTNDSQFTKTTRFSREEWMRLLNWLSTL